MLELDVEAVADADERLLHDGFLPADLDLHGVATLNLRSRILATS